MSDDLHDCDFELDADDAAREDLDATPAVIAQWLAQECEEDHDPLSLEAITDAMLHGSRPLVVPEWLALLFAGDIDYASRAARELRECYRRATQQLADERAAEIRASRERWLRREREEN